MSDDTTMTTEEVASLLRCSPRTVARYRKSGRLRFEKRSPRFYIYRRSDVDFFRDQCREDAGRTEQ